VSTSDPILCYVTHLISNERHSFSTANGSHGEKELQSAHQILQQQILFGSSASGLELDDRHKSNLAASRIVLYFFTLFLKKLHRQNEDQSGHSFDKGALLYLLRRYVKHRKERILRITSLQQYVKLSLSSTQEWCQYFRSSSY